VPAKDKLTDSRIRGAKAGGKRRSSDGSTRPRKYLKLSDGGGLYLLVRPNGSKHWRLKYRVDGKEKLISLGVYPACSLAEAREQRDEAKRQLRAKRDPSEVRKADKAGRRAASENTFAAVAFDWFSKKSATWSASNATIVMRRLEKDVFPEIGSDPVSKLMGPRLLEVLRKVEARGAIESAHRIRQYISSVFRYAVQTHRLHADPTPHPEVLASRTPEKFASITDPKAVGGLIRAIRGYQGSQATRIALQLAPYVFVRPGEIRAAEWSEFDLTLGEWLIPARRTKMRRPHLVPLSAQAVAILREIHKLTGDGRFVFPSERSKARSMSENTLRAALRALGYSNEQMTPHGFRHMASTLLHESRKFRSEVIERQLAHADRNSIRAVYNAAEYLEERVLMMQWWADRLDSLAATDNVVSLKRRTEGHSAAKRT
jgi:integrase